MLFRSQEHFLFYNALVLGSKFCTVIFKLRYGTRVRKAVMLYCDILFFLLSYFEGGEWIYESNS